MREQDMGSLLPPEYWQKRADAVRVMLPATRSFLDRWSSEDRDAVRPLDVRQVVAWMEEHHQVVLVKRELDGEIVVRPVIADGGVEREVQELQPEEESEEAPENSSGARKEAIAARVEALQGERSTPVRVVTADQLGDAGTALVVDAKGEWTAGARPVSAGDGEDVWLTAREAGALAGMQESSIRWMYSGRGVLATRREGSAVLISKRSLLDYLQKRRRTRPTRLEKETLASAAARGAGQAAPLPTRALREAKADEPEPELWETDRSAIRWLLNGIQLGRVKVEDALAEIADIVGDG